MIFSNLSGTTSDEFKVGSGGAGKLISRNAYDIFWRGRADGTQINPNVKRIPNGTDLNTMLEVGQYFAPSNAESPTLINSPTKLAFVMTIEPTVGVLYDNHVYYMQKIIDFVGKMYIRGYDGNGNHWYEWTETLGQSHIAQIAYKSELPTIEEGAIVPDAVNGYIARATNVRYTAYKYSNKTVFDVYGNLALTANNPSDTYSIVNLPYPTSDFPYQGICQFMSINAISPISPSVQYLHGDCIAKDNIITFKLYGYNTGTKTIFSYGINSFLNGANLMFNLSFRVTIG